MQTQQQAQEDEYVRPYHHLVSFDSGYPRMFDYLTWGLDYHGYVSEVLHALPYGDFTRVSEVGCGDGKILLELAKRYPKVQFEGYDTSARAIHYAKGYGAHLPNLRFSDQNMKTASGAYDALLCVETLEHIPDDEINSFVHMLREKTTKYLVVTVPTTVLPLSEKHFRHYTEELLREHLKGFTPLRMYRVHRMDREWLTQLLTTVMLNRFYIARTRHVTAPCFKLYERFCKFADEKTGAHIVGIFQVAS
jgi:cyclopropane fatty-acyl-phospholipid synthase-like methyltransferase